ncbi:hypothetical protein GKODMF_05380 [Candidatus Electrothrix gigas]
MERPFRARIYGKERKECPEGTIENSPVFQHRVQNIASPLTRRYAGLLLLQGLLHSLVDLIH